MNNYSKITYIYGLCNDDNIIRYVGKSDNPFKRLKQHLYHAKEKKTHKDNWILYNNYNINIKILELVSYDIWEEREIFWIKKLKNNNLVNHNEGGLGGGTIIYTSSYNEIKEYAHSLHLKNVKEWYEYIKKNDIPSYVPSNPKEVYTNRGWISWSDFLNTNNISDNIKADNYISYEDAKKWTHANLKDIKTVEQWREFTKIDSFPIFIPRKPNRYYKNRGWENWGMFLNTNKIANQNRIFLNYDDCKNYIKNNYDIKTSTIFRKMAKDKIFPLFIPSNPDKKYKND